MAWILIAAALFLAFVNGANDNFKGVATLYGSGTLSYRRALILATGSTLLGSLLSLVLASGLIRAFSGKGIIPGELLNAPLLASVAIAASLTVLLATRFGFPISTTHALVGGIAGAGWVATGGALEFMALARAFLLPLLAGPILAIGLAYVGLRVARKASRASGLGANSCLCVGQMQVQTACPVHPQGSIVAFQGVPSVPYSTGTDPECREVMVKPVIAVSLNGAIDWSHIVSASLVGFARGLNDTPKIVGLFLGVGVVSALQGTVAVAVIMAIGGWVAARRVAERLSREITPMTTRQGLVANVATSMLVIGASRFGLPVSTTHVSTGAIFGIGGSGGKLNHRTVTQILGAWLVTLPIAAGIAAALMWWQPWT